ncbi:GL14139 [Drosophila persimilis]|uniref:GL14139 n=1 Tax=Drosophila persimilis TaxID=7234 RepID=B4IRQ7_DROPE|nr:GL14139 [Drosophila persimilis]
MTRKAKPPQKKTNKSIATAAATVQLQSRIEKGRSYASAAKSKPIPTQVKEITRARQEKKQANTAEENAGFSFEQLNGDSVEAFGKDLLTCFDIMQSLIKKYPNSSSDKKGKQQLILDFLIQIALN